jgi:hypothetical protein
MTTTSLNDEAELNEYGYSQELHRSLGSFSSFASGFSYISVLTGIIQLSGFGHRHRRARGDLGLPDRARRAAVGGSVLRRTGGALPHQRVGLQLVGRVGGEKTAWLAGYMMLVTDIVSVAAIALGAQALLPQIWSGFQIIGDGTGTSYAQNAVLLGTIMSVFTTVVNIAGDKVMAMINNAAWPSTPARFA